MRRTFRFRLPAVAPSLAVVAAVTLGGCAAQREPIITGSVPEDGYRTRHPILLTEQAETIDIPVGSQAARLTEREASTVSAFAADALENGASGVTVMVPTGSANEASAYRISRQIGAALVKGGLNGHAVSYTPYTAADPEADAPIRLAYPRMKAGLDHRCGQWPDQMTSSKDNKDYWNFGCAMQANVAAMVVDPTDLVTPRGNTTSSAARRQKIFQNYEAGEQTTSKQKLENQGNITNLSGG